MDVEINYIWKNVAPDGRCSLHALSETLGLPNETNNHLKYYLQMFFAEYQNHIMDKYKFNNEELHLVEVENYIRKKQLQGDNAQQIASQQMAEERDNVQRIANLTDDLINTGNWANNAVSSVGAFSDLMKWYLDNKWNDHRNYQIITVEHEHTLFDTNCPSNMLVQSHQCNEQAIEKIKNFANIHEKIIALNNQELIIFVTNDTHWGVLMPQALEIALEDNKEKVRRTFPLEPPAPQDDGPRPRRPAGKLPAIPEDPDPSIPDWFTGKEYEPRFKGIKKTKDNPNPQNPLTMVVPKYMDKIDKCAMIFDMLHDFADEGAITNVSWRQYWIFIKIATAIFVEENATLEEQYQEEINVVNCLNSVFKNFQKGDDDNSQIPIPDYTKGQTLYQVMKEYNQINKTFFKDMKTFLTHTISGAQTLLYKNIFEKAFKAFFYDPIMIKLKTFDKDDKPFSEMIPTVKMMTTQDENSNGFGDRARLPATPYQDNDGWNCLLNATSQEFDGCRLTGDYPMGQIWIDKDDDERQLKEAIKRFKEETGEYQKFQKKKTIVETIKKQTWNEGIYAPETLFIDAMKSSSSVPAVSESIMRSMGGSEQNIARNQTLKGAAQEFDMANAGFPIKENKGKYFGDIEPECPHNGVQLKLEDALDCVFEMHIYFTQNKRLKIVQTPFSNEPIEQFLKITRINYTNLLKFLLIGDIKNYMDESGKTRITLKVMNEFFNNEELFQSPPTSIQIAGKDIALLWHSDDVSLFESIHKEAKSFYAQYALSDPEDKKEGSEHLKPFLNANLKGEERIFEGGNSKKYTFIKPQGKKKGEIAGMDQYANYFRPRVRDTKKNRENRPEEIGQPDFPFLEEFDDDDDDRYYKAYLIHLLMHDMKIIKKTSFKKDDTFNREQIPDYEESIIQRFLNVIESSFNQTNRKSIVRQKMVYEFKINGDWKSTTADFNCLSYGQDGPSVMQLEFQWRKLLLSITKNLGIKTDAKKTATFLKKNSERDPSSRIKGKGAMKRGTELDKSLDDQQNSWFQEMVELEKNENKKTKKKEEEEHQYENYLNFRDVFDLYLALDQLCEDIKEEGGIDDKKKQEIGDIQGGMNEYAANNKIEEPNTKTKLPNGEEVKQHEEYFEDRRIEILNYFNPDTDSENHRKWTEHLVVLQSNAYSSRSTSDDLFKTTRKLVHDNLGKKIKMKDCWKLLSMPLLTKFYSDSGQIQFVKGISHLFRKDKHGKIYKYWIVTFDLTCGLIALKEGNVMLETGKRIFVGSSGPIKLHDKKVSEAVIKKKMTEISDQDVGNEEKINKQNILRLLYNICPKFFTSQQPIDYRSFFYDLYDLNEFVDNTINLKKTNEMNKNIFKLENRDLAENYKILDECCREVELNTLLDESIALTDREPDEFSKQLQQLKKLVNQLKTMRFEKDNKKCALLLELNLWQSKGKGFLKTDDVDGEETDDSDDSSDDDSSEAFVKKSLYSETQMKEETIKRTIVAHDKDIKVIEKAIKNWETVIKSKTLLLSKENDVSKLIFTLKDFLNDIKKSEWLTGRSGNLPSEGILNDIRPQGMVGEHPVTKEEEGDVYWLFHESNKEWDKRQTFHHEDKMEKRAAARKTFDDTPEPSKAELLISEYVGHDSDLGMKLDPRGSIYKNVKAWMDHNKLLNIEDEEKQHLPQKKRGKKGGITQATKTNAINNKIIKTIVILEMMGKIKEEKKPNPLDGTTYHVDLDTISKEDIKEIREKLKISAENNNEGFEKEFFNFWVLKGDKKDKDRKELLDYFKQLQRSIQEYYAKAYTDNKRMDSENSLLRSLTKEEWDESIKKHLPEEGNPYREITKYSVQQTFEDTPSIFRNKMDKLVEIWGEKGKKFDLEVLEEKKKKKPVSRGSPAGSNLSSPNKNDSDSPRTPFHIKTRGKTTAKTSLQFTPGKSASSSSLTSSPPGGIPHIKRNYTDMLGGPPNPGVISKMTADDIEKALVTLKRSKHSQNFVNKDDEEEHEELIQNKINAYEDEQKKRKDRDVTVRKEKGPKKKKKKGGNKTQKIYRKKGRKSQNKRKKPKKGSKKRHKKPHRNTRKIALKIEN